MKNYFLALVFFSTILFAQAPSIKYTGVLSSYSTNKPITPLTPTNVGGAPTNKTLVSTFVGRFNYEPYLTGATATFMYPIALTTAPDGTMYEVDSARPVISKITSSGYTTQFVGNVDRAANMYEYSGYGYVDGSGDAIRVNRPEGLATDTAGNLYLADTQNNRIRKITTDRIATTIAGNGIAGFADGTGTASQFNLPTGICLDSSGNIYVSDTGNNRIRKITPNGVVTTVAGFLSGNVDGNGINARFKKPNGIVVDTSGNLFVSDSGNKSIRKIDVSGNVTTYVSAAVFGGTPRGLVLSKGSLFASDCTNNQIKKVTSSNTVSVYAGYQFSTYFKNGTGDKAWFYEPEGLTADASGNIYVADKNVNQIRKIALTASAYSITPDLPKGLSLNSDTGMISGTPLQASPNTTYTVTASNYSGTSSTTLSFQVIN